MLSRFERAAVAISVPLLAVPSAADSAFARPVDSHRETQAEIVAGPIMLPSGPLPRVDTDVMKPAKTSDEPARETLAFLAPIVPYIIAAAEPAAASATIAVGGWILKKQIDQMRAPYDYGPDRTIRKPIGPSGGRGPSRFAIYAATLSSTLQHDGQVTNNAVTRTQYACEGCQGGPENPDKKREPGKLYVTSEVTRRNGVVDRYDVVCRNAVVVPTNAGRYIASRFLPSLIPSGLTNPFGCSRPKKMRLPRGLRTSITPTP